VGRYKVEHIDYEYNWIDVGPGPRERGGISHMSSMVRDYRKTYNTLKEVFGEFDRLQNLRWSPDIIIVSKFEGREYTPGKLTVLTGGRFVWWPVIQYTWKRNPRTKIDFFDLVTTKGEYHVVTQSQFFKIEPTLSELMECVSETFYSKKFMDSLLSKFQPMLPLLTKEGRIT